MNPLLWAQALHLRAPTLEEIDLAAAGKLALFHEACGRRFALTTPYAPFAPAFSCAPCGVLLGQDYYQRMAGEVIEAYAKCLIDPRLLPPEPTFKLVWVEGGQSFYSTCVPV